ncbi:cytochrome P450 18a1 [Chrysoperla carnea]|nr:cytochrome P450 18a1 [Chrysoperla carnea]
MLAVFLLALCVVRFIQFYMELKALPPGPWGVPILGLLPTLSGIRAPYLHYLELKQKYGPLFSMKVGSQLHVIMTDYKLIRDTFRKDEFSGRPQGPFHDLLSGYGIINSEGKLWKDQRRFLHNRFRNFGVTYLGSGKNQIEKRIMGEVVEFLSVLKSFEGAPTDPSPILSVCISNVICEMMMSVRFTHNDPKFLRFMGLTQEGLQLWGSMNYATCIPVLQYFPKFRVILKKLGENRDEMSAFFQEQLEEHRRTFDPENIRDLIDTYLLEIEKAKENGTDSNLFEGRNHDRQIRQVIADLFTAGMETIKNTLQFAILYMIHHPESLRAVQDELDQIVGRNRLPKLEDLPYLPTTESTLYEVMRISSIVPLGTEHSPIRDVTVNGYRIPQNTHVHPFLHAVHMDPNLWDEPERFNPSRFINSAGNCVKPEYFLPFGVGRRMCLGDVLARMELFLFFSSMLHTFNISVPEGEKLPSLKPNSGITLFPEAFKVCFKPRSLNTDTVHPRQEKNIGVH